MKWCAASAAESERIESYRGCWKTPVLACIGYLVYPFKKMREKQPYKTHHHLSVWFTIIEWGCTTRHEGW